MQSCHAQCLPAAWGMTTRSRVSRPGEKANPDIEVNAPVLWSRVNPEISFSAVLTNTNLPFGSTAMEDGLAPFPNWIGVPAIEARSPAAPSAKADNVSPPVSPTNTNLPLGSTTIGTD